MHGWQANLKRTCASPVAVRAMPENEIPPVLRGDIYFFVQRAYFMGSFLLFLIIFNFSIDFTNKRCYNYF